MLRVLVLLMLMCTLSSSLVAEDAIETARVALDKAKKLYSDTTERANADLQAAVTREIKRQRASTKRSVEDQLAFLQTLEGELQQLEMDGKLPTAELLKDEVTLYKETLRKAKLKCEKAFDALAQRYVTAKDDTQAKTVLADKQKYFLRTFKSGTFQVTTLPPFGLSVVDLRADGTFTQVQDESATSTGTWDQTKDDELLLTYDVTNNYGTVTLKIVDRDHLTGMNEHPNGNKWTWKMARSSAATFPTGAFLCTTVPDEGEWTWTLNKDGTHTNVQGDRTYRGTWEQSGEEIVFHFASQNFSENEFSTGRLKIVDQDHLTGTNTQHNGLSWKWTVVRKSPSKTKK